MEDVSQRIASLSPEQRALFDVLLKRTRQTALDTQRIPRRRSTSVCLPSLEQERLWFIHQMDPSNVAYNIPLPLRLRGAIDLALLQRSLDEIVRRHESVRTRFGDEDGRPFMQVMPTLDVPLELIDRQDAPDAELDVVAQRSCDEVAARTFDTLDGPLIRGCVIRLRPNDHVLILVLHHIITDWVSSQSLIGELTTCYQAFRAGQVPELPELPIQYADFAEWQREWLQGEVLESHLAYWRTQLAHTPPLLDLPLDYPRPLAQTFCGGRQYVQVAPALTMALKELSRAEGLTLFMTVLTLFSILLGRYSGQDDILVGSPSANRTRADIKHLIGYFLNMMVLRTRLAGNPSVRAVMQQVRAVTLAAFEHQDVPLAKIIEALKLPRNVSYPPLFQVSLLFLAPQMPSLVEELAVEPMNCDAGSARFDLSLILWDDPMGWDSAEGMFGFFEYNSMLFHPTTMRQMHDHFIALLEQVVRDPDQRVWDVPLMGDSERARILVDWNATAAAYPTERCVHQLVEAQAARLPSAIALVGSGGMIGRGTFDPHHPVPATQRMTYHDLDGCANQVAHYLRALGVGPEVLVGVCMDRSPDLVVALLGVLKAGGAYVPLDPTYPVERLAFMVSDSAVAVLLTMRVHRAAAEAIVQTARLRTRVVCLDSDWPTIAQQPMMCPASGVLSGNLAYVIYTSGSTGRPKGVQVPHAAVVNFLVSMQERPGLTAQDGVLSVTTMSFDIAALEVFLPLIVGARVELVPREAAADGGYLSGRLHAAETTMMQASPTTWQLVLASEWAGNARLKVLCGGEELPRVLAEQLRGRCDSLWNMYGPTETTIWSALHQVGMLEGSVPIGRPIANTCLYVLDAQMQPLPVGIAGELYIGGEGLSRGYLGRPDLTAERFVPNPFGAERGMQKVAESPADSAGFPALRLYRTGDLVRYHADGTIAFVGRVDQQVKVRGVRIELGEIEHVLMQFAGVRSAVVVVREDQPGDKRLVAYVQFDTGVVGEQAALVPPLRAFAHERLPDAMLPAIVVVMERMPLTPNGKIDRAALPIPESSRPEQSVAYLPPRTPLEQQIAGIWREILRLEQVGVQDNFFDIGGHSLLMVQAHSLLRKRFNIESTIVDLMRYPTIAALVGFIEQRQRSSVPSVARAPEVRVPVPPVSVVAPVVTLSAHQPESPAAPSVPRATDVAIVAMAGRFPGGAATIEAFWERLRDGRELITHLTDAEINVEAIDPRVLSDPNFVRAGGYVDGIEDFDALFFGYNPREAEIIDPQQRVFLECAWEVLERAGYDPDTYPGAIGVYAGAGMNTYVMAHLITNPQVMGAIGHFQAMIANDKDFLSTRVSYKLNLSGPSMGVQTACSTSLVAVHVACQSLLNRECDMAMAGGVSLRVPQRTGYMFHESDITSPDGHCRAFDARAQGTVASDGAAVVLLKRLEDALADGDQVLAVIKGSAINNDGALKIGYTAPSVVGQAKAVAAALARAAVPVDSIGYVEAHGTGTPLGDPTEVAALTQAFRTSTDACGFCAIGSVKSNVGHLDTAAGAAGLIKAVLALQHGLIPASLHFEQPNPEIDFARSPFYVSAQATPWPRGVTPRRAGVNSLGLGGTNAHVILEEAPDVLPSGSSRSWQVMMLSAKTSTALESVTANVLAYLERDPAVSLADVAHTLRVGRKAFAHRRMVVCRDRDDAIQVLRSRNPQRLLTSQHATIERPVVFMFPGGGAQYVGMAAQLYEEEPVFRAEVERCLAVLQPLLSYDLRALLYPPAEAAAQAADLLTRTSVALPALFTVEYALARLLMSWGIRPRAMIGHSLGEYVAACLAGVFTLEDALALVVLRGQLFEQLPGGAMLSVALPEDHVQVLLGPQLSLAAVNGPAHCVVSGPLEAIDRVLETLTGRGVECRRLEIDVAAHSALVAPLLPALTTFLMKLTLNPPQMPYVSNVTGTWITPQEATDPQYWAKHLRQTVRFADGMRQLLDDPGAVFLEVGPGRTLSTLTRSLVDRTAGTLVMTTVRHPHEAHADVAFLLSTVGRLWLLGVTPDWVGFVATEQRRRVLLPTYPFERQRYWVEAATLPVPVAQSEGAAEMMSGGGLSSHPRPELLVPYAPPEGPIEQRLAMVWQELLGIDLVGIHDDFFELGGQSLIATRLVSRLRSEFPIEIPLRRLFESATIATQAKVIEELLTEKLEQLSDEEAEQLVAQLRGAL